MNYNLYKKYSSKNEMNNKFYLKNTISMEQIINNIDNILQLMQLTYVYKHVSLLMKAKCVVITHWH